MKPLAIDTLLRAVQTHSPKAGVKYSQLHPVEPWLVWANQQGVVQLWDHRRRVCLKAFHLSSLDQLSGVPTVSSVWKVRKVMFLDSGSLFHQFYPGQSGNLSLRVAGQRLLIVLPHRVYFYDYLSDKCTSLAEKGVKQVTPIDEHYLALGYSDGQIRILDMGTFRVVKTLRGYHQKAFTFLWAYKQNHNQRARLLAASKDGMIGCWNADTEGVAFKF